MTEFDKAMNDYYRSFRRRRIPYAVGVSAFPAATDEENIEIIRRMHL